MSETAQTTTAQKPVDIKTISGLLEILGDNIKSLNTDSSEINIKKTNAILQNVNAIKGIYSLAFDKQRLEIINERNRVKRWYELDDKSREYQTNRELLGNVLGDSTDREQRDLEIAEQGAYESVKKRLESEIYEIKESGDLETTYTYAEYTTGELAILNKLLNKSKKTYTTTLTQCEYLVENLKPEDFREYAKARLV